MTAQLARNSRGHLLRSEQDMCVSKVLTTLSTFAAICRSFGMFTGGPLRVVYMRSRAPTSIIQMPWVIVDPCDVQTCTYPLRLPIHALSDHNHVVHPRFLLFAIVTASSSCFAPLQKPIAVALAPTSAHKPNQTKPNQFRMLSHKSLPGQLHLPLHLPGLPPSLRRTQRQPLAQLDLVLLAGPRAGAVRRLVDAGQRRGAEVLVADGCVRGECQRAPASTDKQSERPELRQCWMENAGQNPR